MASFMNEFEHLRIQLEEIKRATNGFSNKVIGAGGFGSVYQGEVSHSKGRCSVAIKRLNRQFGQGDPEFLKEIMLLSRYTHQNLVSLLGFCDEEDEKVLIYEFASKGSLDRHLSDPDLTWVQRIKICLGAAKGLSYLHDPEGRNQRVLHCDIKSANILLDESLTAKVADFGLSKMGPANQQYSVLLTNALGTAGYCDPLFIKMFTLTKESDVYSFGVVLFEVLCGSLCYQYSNGQVKIFVDIWKQKFLENEVDKIVLQHLKPQMHPTTLKLFSDVAFQCLNDSREGRPTMSIVVESLEKTLEFQELYDLKVPEAYKVILHAAVPPLRFTSIDDLNHLFSNGVILNAENTWFSRNDKGAHYILKFIHERLIQEAGQRHRNVSRYIRSSSFPLGSYPSSDCRFKACVKTQFLSPLMTYRVSLVFQFEATDDYMAKGCILLKYKLAGDKYSQLSHAAYDEENGWWKVELYHFINEGTTVDLEIIFDGSRGSVIVEGIEFLPLETVELQILEEDQKHVNLEASLSDPEDDTFWENKLPTDYKDIIKFSKQRLQWKTNKELYYILFEGLLINYNPFFSSFQQLTIHGQQWFCIDKNGKTCIMLPARAVCILENNWNKVLHEWKPLPQSRFEEGLVASSSSNIVIKENNKFGVLSSQTNYACYLVYKIEKSEYVSLMSVKYKSVLGSRVYWDLTSLFYLVSPKTPVIRPKAGQNTHNPSCRPKLIDVPQQRKDGWMEVEIWRFQTDTSKTSIPRLILSSAHGDHKGLTIMGIDFRPR
uniref:uncharacterized protein LOC122598584 n=1 Tax=Erigeron canadensis TaxID=72917 RepID=UPI001CB964DE|nr:uncharacterized protein LOC122598584 [Erigeron canadensis]